MAKIQKFLVLGLCINIINLKMISCQTLNLRSVSRNQTRQTASSPSPVSVSTAPTPVSHTSLSNAEERLDLPYSSGPLLVFLQRMNDRLTTTEALQNQQLRKLDSIDYKLTRIEILSQDKVATSDKPDGQVIRKLESLEWEISKFGTLIEVIRQDLDKIQQRQMDIKATLTSSNNQRLFSSRGQTVTSKARGEEELQTDGTGGELAVKFHNLAFSTQQINKATEVIQAITYGMNQNLTDLNNMTRNLLSNMSQLVSKQYFLTAIKDVLTTNQHSPSMIVQSSCENKGEDLPRDCSDVQETGFNISGVYRIQPHKCNAPFFAFCDLESDGGGWTVIQRRSDGAINFYKEWLEYKHGFGNTAGEHWLGNEKIHWITNQAVYELHIGLEDFEGVEKTARYSAFSIGSEIDGYMIKLLGSYDGNAGDSFSYHASVKFSTKDIDNDPWDGGHCAELHTGGWWYKGCETANLNGQYLSGQVPQTMEYQGVYWYEWHGPEYSLQKTVMKIRPVHISNKNLAEPKQ